MKRYLQRFLEWLLIRLGGYETRDAMWSAERHSLEVRLATANYELLKQEQHIKRLMDEVQYFTKQLTDREMLCDSLRKQLDVATVKFNALEAQKQEIESRLFQERSSWGNERTEISKRMREAEETARVAIADLRKFSQLKAVPKAVSAKDGSPLKPYISLTPLGPLASGRK